MYSRLFPTAFLAGVIATGCLADTQSPTTQSHAPQTPDSAHQRSDQGGNAARTMEHIEVVGYPIGHEIDHAIAHGTPATTLSKQEQRRELLRNILENQLHQLESLRQLRETQGEESLAQEAAPVPAEDGDEFPPLEALEVIPVGEVEGEEALAEEAVSTEPS